MGAAVALVLFGSAVVVTRLAFAQDNRFPELPGMAGPAPGLPGSDTGVSPPDAQILPVADVPLRLRDAIAGALHQLDIARILDGGAVRLDPVSTYDTEAARAERDASFAAFDPSATIGYVGSQINEPPSSFFGPGISQPTRRDEGDFTASLNKLWQTGATTTLSYAPPLGYLFIPDDTSSGFNPIYSSAYVFDVRQPLLRGAGWKVNLAPLRIAQLRYQQSTWEFKQAMLAAVRSIEQAYWELQAAQVILAANEAALPLAREAVRIEEARVQTEWAVRADVARARVQLLQIEQDITALTATATQREFRLRRLMGLPLVDGHRLVPSDPPAQTVPPLDVAAGVQIAEQFRPELVQRRLAVKIREQQWLVARNGVKPRLDLQALYRANGVGQELDDALEQAGAFDFTDWTLGLTFSMPLGNREPKAELRAAEWELARDRAYLRESLQNVELQLAELQRERQAAVLRYEQARQQADAAREWLDTSRIRFTYPQPGSQSPDALLLLLFDYQTAVRANINAVTQVAALLAEINTLAARYEEEVGTLLDRWAIEIDRDPVIAVQCNLAASPHTQAVTPINPMTDYRASGLVVTPPGTPGWTTPHAAPPTGFTLPSPAPPSGYHQNSVRR